MRNVIYKVSFEVNPLLDGEFDFKEEALAWANDHLADKPVVKAVDIEYSDEFGGEPIIHEEEEIFHYPVENVISDEDEDYLATRLAELERDALEADPYGADEFDGHEEFKEDTLSETDQVAVNCVDAHGELKEEAELIEADDKNDKNLVSKETLLQLKKLFGSENLEEANNEKVQPGEFEKAIKDFADYLDKDIPAIDPSKKVQPSELEKTIKDFGDYLGKDIGNEIPASSSRKKVQPGEFEKTIKDIADSLQEDVILFDPFGCDFSDCKPMEVCADEHRADCCVDIKQAPVDFLKELAAELGLEDEVEISEKECADGSCEEKHEDEIPCEDCKDEISKVSDEAKVEEPVVVEDEVKVDVAPEAEVAAEEDIVPEEVKANEEPNVEVQVEDEKPAEEISKCHVCPECGKEICECGNKELVEGIDLKEIKCYIDDQKMYDEESDDKALDRVIEKFNISDEELINGIKEYIINGNEEIFSKNLDEAKNKVTYTTGDPAIGDAHFNGAFEGGEGCSENLEESENEKVTVDNMTWDTFDPEILINAAEEEQKNSLKEDYDRVSYIACKPGEWQGTPFSSESAAREQADRWGKGAKVKKIVSKVDNYNDTVSSQETTVYTVAEKNKSSWDTYGSSTSYTPPTNKYKDNHSVYLLDGYQIPFDKKSDAISWARGNANFIQKLFKGSKDASKWGIHIADRFRVFTPGYDVYYSDIEYYAKHYGGYSSNDLKEYKVWYYNKGTKMWEQKNLPELKGINEALKEESHPQEAQPEVDMTAAFNKALEVAKKENKPVIYGYNGPDHHGKNRYFEIEHVICDDLDKCIDDVMKQYHPHGTVLVAHPGQDFAEEFAPRNCDLENKELFIEDKEMSDEEFAEAFKKGLEEKHCQK